jgi:hypothetical protein
MSLHEQVDRIRSWTPRTKVAVAGIAVLVLLASVAGLMYLGYRFGTSWADSKFLQEREKNLQKIAVLEADAERHEKNEAELAAQNSILRKEHEAMAEVLKTADTDRERKAALAMADRNTQLNAQLNEIDAETDHDKIICGICEQARKGGRPLSAEFCRRCEGK